jgi:hypothetical protein
VYTIRSAAIVYATFKEVNFSADAMLLLGVYNYQFGRIRITTRESHIYPMPDFSFVPVILPPVHIVSWGPDPTELVQMPDPTQPIQMPRILEKILYK